MDKNHLVVVGASSGLGEACVSRFAKSFNVTAISRSGSFCGDFNNQSVNALSCDATSLDDLKNAFDESVGKFGKISVLINSAGVQNIKPVRSFKANDIDEMLKINIGASFNLATLFASNTYTLPDAVFCLISSISAKRPESGIVFYGATKAATENLVSGLAKELAPRRIVGVSPGWMDTPMTQKYSHIYNDKFKSNILSKYPLGFVGVHDVVNSIEFLISSDAAKITGQTLIVDSGAML